MLVEDLDNSEMIKLTDTVLHLPLIDLVLGLYLGPLLGDLQQPLVLLLQLGLEGVELGHLGVAGSPHPVYELLHVRDTGPGVRDVLGQVIHFGFLRGETLSSKFTAKINTYNRFKLRSNSLFLRSQINDFLSLSLPK